MFDALGLPYKPEAGSTSTVFDEQKAVLSIHPAGEPRNDAAHFVEVFDVNGNGDAYIVYDKFMYQYDAGGKLKEARPLPGRTGWWPTSG